MKYKKVKNSTQIITRSDYLINNPQSYKNKWREVFGNNNPIKLELGMGRGDFIVKMAKKYPKINFIGLEIDDNQLVKATQRLSTSNLNNIVLIKADAQDIDLIFGHEIDTIYLTFSEPWPKAVNENRRFTHINYLKLYDKIFKKNKHIILKTDNKGFFAYSLQTLSQYWYTFDRVSLDLHHDETISNIMTDFEQQYFKEKRPIYYVDASFKN